jgi:outer membrane protein TolC
MMRWVNVFLMLSLLGFSFISKAEEVLGIHEFLKLARQNDTEIKKILHERVQTTFLKDLSLPSSAVVLSAQNEYGFTLDDGERTTVWRLGAEKPIQTTGTTLVAAHEINEQEDREIKETTIGVEQSLVKNAFGKQYRRLDRKLSKENEVILLQTVETYEDYIASLLLNYLDWQLTHLNRKAAKSLLDESERLQRIIRGRQKRHIASTVDVGKITLESMGYKEALLELDILLSDQMATIISTIGQKAPSKHLIPTDDLKWLKKTPDFKKDKEESLKNSRTLKAYTLTEEAGQLDISVRKEDLHPDLNLVFGFSYDDSTRYNVATDRKELFVGFNLTFPLWQTAKRADVKKAQYEKMSTKLARIQYLTNLTSYLDAQMIKAQKQQERVRLSKEKLTLSEDVAKEELKRYENGKIDLETLMIARQAVPNNLVAFLRNQIQLNKDLIEWFRLTDQLVVKDSVKLQ